MRKVRERIGRCAAALLLPLLLAGCAPRAFRLDYGIADRVRTADPQLAAGDAELLLVRNIFEGLYRLNEAGEPVPGAAACEVTDGGKVYTFTVREGAKWADGRALTADDFAFGLERALSPETESPNAGALFCIENAEAFYRGEVPFGRVGVAAVSERELRVTLRAAEPDFPAVLTEACAMPCNRAFFESTKGRYGLDAESVLSNGSFSLQSWDGQNGLVLRKAPLYNGDFPANAYAVRLTEAEDGDTAAQLTAGQTDACRLRHADEAGLPEDRFTVQKFPVYTCALLLSAEIDDDLREILTESADFAAVRAGLPAAFAPSDTLLPPSLGGEAAYTPAYSPAEARKAFLAYTKTHPAPALTILCVDHADYLTPLKQIAAYWQNGLGLYDVRIETAADEAEAYTKLETRACNAAFLPLQDGTGSAYDFLYGFSADSPQNYLNRNPGNFERELAKLGKRADAASASAAVRALYEENLVVPVCADDKVFAIDRAFRGAVFRPYGGETDFAGIRR